MTALAKDVRRGDVESAFLMLLEPANPVATKEVDTELVGGDGSVANGLLVGISFVMSTQMCSNHLVFLPNVKSSTKLSCYLVPHYSIVTNIAFLLQN